MKTITFKADEIFFEKVTKLAKRLHISKSELIREAINEYERNLYKKRLKQMLQEESLKSRSLLKKEIEALEESSLDGLENV